MSPSPRRSTLQVPALRALLRRVFAALALLSCLAIGARAEPEFKSANTPHYTFEWTRGLDGYARALMEKAEGYHEKIYGELGVKAGERRTRVSILQDEDAMLELAEGRHGRAPPRWADGLAYPQHGVIYLHIGSGPDAIDETFRHEMSHIAVGRIAPPGRLPLWFYEGVAIRQSEGLSLERAWLLTQAATLGNLLPLDQLERGFPKAGERVGIAYAQSVNFVGHLMAEGGEQKFGALLERVGKGERLAEATLAVYDKSLAAIEHEWRSNLETRWGWVPILFGTTALWGIAGFLLLSAWRRKRRLRAAALARMESDEILPLEDDIVVSAQPEREAPFGR